MYLEIGEWIWNQADGEPGYWAPPGGLSGAFDIRSIAEQAMPGTTHGERRGRCLVISPAPLGSDFITIGEIDGKSDQKSIDAFAAGTGWTPEGDTVARLVYDLLTRGSHPDGELGVKPLMPGSNRLSIYLPGVGKVWQEGFRYGDHPHTSRVQDVERISYRSALLNATPGTDSKFLGWLGIKYRTKVPQDFFIPRDLPKINPRKPETAYSDNFDRADSTNLGGSWTEILNDVQISSNGVVRAVNGANCLARYDSDLSGTDHKSAVGTSHSGMDAGFAGCITRKDSSGTVTCYAHYGSWGGDTAVLGKFVSGTLTSIQTSPYTLTNNTTGPSIRGNDVGSTIKTAFNASDLVGVTDTSITTGLRCGIFLFSLSSSLPKVTDWDCADATSSGAGGGGSGAVGSGGGLLVNNPVVLNPAGIA